MLQDDVEAIDDGNESPALTPWRDSERIRAWASPYYNSDMLVIPEWAVTDEA